MGFRSALFSRKQPGGVFVIDAADQHPGSIFWVHLGTGTDAAGAGQNPDKPLATIDYAVGLCTADKGDVIYVMPGHAETVVAAAGIDVDIAGVSVVGLGRGSLKPTITMGTATTATVRMQAANTALKNLRFVNNIDSIVKIVNVNADHVTIEGCDFVTSSTKEALSFINLATTKDYLTVKGCRFEQPTDPGGTDGGADTGAIYLVDSEYILIQDCWFQGQFETAIIHNRTTKCRYLWVRDCHGIQMLSGAEPFQLVADVDGGVYGGMFITPAETAAVEATLVGTIGDKFFISPTTGFGNDGAAGGQGGIIVATAS